MADEITSKDVEELKGTLKDIQDRLVASAAAVQTPSAGTPVATVRTSSVSGDPGEAYDKLVGFRRELMENYSAHDLHRMIGIQMRKGTADGMGQAFDRWANQAVIEAMPPEVVKLLDTAGGAALIRQDLEPLLYAAYVKDFPFYERIQKKPSNGLVHAYNRIDALPTAGFISDTGTVVDSSSTYTRATTNIAIVALRVGTSLRAQFAVRAGGMSYDPDGTEVKNGLTAIAKKMQQTLFAGNESVPGKVATDPEGLFDPLSFNGLRISIPTANILAHTSTAPILEKLNTADKFNSVSGGRASIILMDGRDRIDLMNELQPNVRFVDKMPVVPGLPSVEAVNLGHSGLVPVLSIPGSEMGEYTVSGASVRDAYLLDESVIAAPWLGSESPTVLEIPVGVSGQLTKLYIIFMMMGLEIAVPKFNAKIRLAQ